MKTKFIFCCFLLPLAAMVFWGCPSEKPIGDIKMLQELRDYTIFREGTYWIYQDLAKDIEDSVYITKTEDYELRGNPNEGCTMSGTEIYFYSTYYQKNFIQDFEFYCNLSNFQRSIINSDMNVIFFSGSYYENEKERPLHFGDKAWYTTYDTLYPLYSLLNKSYEHVKVFSVSAIQYNTIMPIKSYHAPHIGMIQKEMEDSTVWQLVRYNIVQ